MVDFFFPSWCSLCNRPSICLLICTLFDLYFNQKVLFIVELHAQSYVAIAETKYLTSRKSSQREDLKSDLIPWCIQMQVQKIPFFSSLKMVLCSLKEKQPRNVCVSITSSRTEANSTLAVLLFFCSFGCKMAAASLEI